MGGPEPNTARRSRIVVVDDDGDLRQLVRLALEAARFEIVGEASNGQEAITLSQQLHPDIIVLDLGLPDLPHGEVLDRIRHGSPDARVVVFSGLDDHAAQTAVLNSGAARYVLKRGDVGVLVAAVNDVADTTRVASAVFPAETRSARAAREFAESTCTRWQCDEVLDSALLLTSELVTNAVVHARSQCNVTLRLWDEVLRIEVTDDSSHSPSPLDVDETSENGRGLFLVAALSRSWGIDPADDGKVVWAELSRAG